MRWPTFVETKHMIRDEYEQSGEQCSSRKAHRIARALDDMRQRGINNWSLDDEPDLIRRDPTAQAAIRRVLARFDHAEETAA